MVCTLGGFEQGDGAGVFGLIRLIGVVRLVDVLAAVQAGGHIAAGVDNGAVLVLMLARGHLAVAVAVALDRSVILAGLQLGGFLHSGLIIASSENASKRPAAGLPFKETGGWRGKEICNLQ